MWILLLWARCTTKTHHKRLIQPWKWIKNSIQWASGKFSMFEGIRVLGHFIPLCHLMCTYHFRNIPFWHERRIKYYSVWRLSNIKVIVIGLFEWSRRSVTCQAGFWFGSQLVVTGCINCNTLSHILIDAVSVGVPTVKHYHSDWHHLLNDAEHGAASKFEMSWRSAVFGRHSCSLDLQQDGSSPAENKTNTTGLWKWQTTSFSFAMYLLAPSAALVVFITGIRAELNRKRLPAQAGCGGSSTGSFT